jgi:hypothetical protein
MIDPEVRLPLAPLSDANHRKLVECLESYKLLPAAVAAD